MQVTVFALYAMAARRVLGTIGHPLQAAKAHRRKVMLAAKMEQLAQQNGLTESVGPGQAAAAAAREELEPLPRAYLPSVSGLLLMLIAVGAHVLLSLGKRWSVKFHAWCVQTLAAVAASCTGYSPDLSL